MRLKKPVVDYRKLRFHNVTSKEYRHLFLLLLWIGFAVLFYTAEAFHPTNFYYDMYWPAVDDAIPFCEWFLIPYLFWFVYMLGIHLYTGFYDLASFRKLMAYIGITYYAGVITFYVFPTVQNLRPDLSGLGRDNFLIRFMAGFYEFDTNTNVCPSLHVVGSVAVWASGINCPGLQKRGWKIFFTVSTLLISASTVFLKQHSIIDVIAAIPICAIAYWLVYKRKDKKSLKN